jgi:hypothetical protein
LCAAISPSHVAASLALVVMVLVSGDVTGTGPT